jgi:hypothetical protein
MRGSRSGHNHGVTGFKERSVIFPGRAVALCGECEPSGLDRIGDADQ